MVAMRGREIRMAADTAFALAGLGGFNAHGAGFLQAARDNQYKPDLVTATSGQIAVLAAYLEDQPDLRTGLIDAEREKDPFPQLETALFGYQGVFRPAYGEAIARFLRPPFFGASIEFYADRFLPAQLYKPTRTAEYIDGLVHTFSQSTIGVVFNAYDPKTGKGVLYGNDAARLLMNTKSSVPLLPGETGSDPRTVKAQKGENPIENITPEAIRSALWLSLYGFQGIPGGNMDGAYHRSCILSELHNFDEVIVVRPLANGWRMDKMPRSYFDVQDWNTEMWFSAGYKAEVDGMKRINALVARKIIENKDFKQVRLHEIEPDTPAGYFNYFIERESVYDDAPKKADALFKKLKNKPKASSVSVSS
jgi:hypothetical protein